MKQEMELQQTEYEEAIAELETEQDVQVCTVFLICASVQILSVASHRLV